MDSFKKLYDFNPAHEDHIVKIRKFPGKNLDFVLFSRYLYSLIIQGRKITTPDFFFFFNQLKKTLSNEDDPTGLVYQIVNNCVNSAQLVYESLDWLYRYILESSTDLASIASILIPGNSEEEKCQRFSKEFNVHISLISNNETKEFKVSKQGRFLKLVIAKVKNEYCFPYSETDLELEENYSKWITDEEFDQEPYIIENGGGASDSNFAEVQLAIDPNLKYSNPVPIDSEFINISTPAKNELSTEFGSIVLVQEDNNQIRAFAYHFLQFILDARNGECLKSLVYKFQSGKTFCDLPYSIEQDIYQSLCNPYQFIAICIDLVKFGSSRPEVFPEISYLIYNPYCEQTISTLHFLCKIFGVSAEVITQDSSSPNFFRQRLGGSSDKLTPVFHFLALATNEGFQVHSLNTKRNDFLRGVNFSSATQSIILDNFELHETKCQTVQAEVVPEAPKQDIVKEEFLIGLASVQNKIIKNYLESIRVKLPIFIRENVSDLIENLKPMRYKLQPDNREDFFNYEVFSYSNEKFNDSCHICRQVPKNKSFYSSSGCYFHLDCFKQIYPSVSTFDVINCPQVGCDGKVSIRSYLDLEENLNEKNIKKIVNDKKVKCCSCDKMVKLSDGAIAQGNFTGIHCKYCSIKILYIKTCAICNGNKATISDDTKVKCQGCLVPVMALNFGYAPNQNILKCKKCWMEEIKLYVSQGNQLSLNLVLTSVYGLQDATIPCSSCGQQGFKVYSDHFCQNCQVKPCLNCFNENICVLCGMPYIKHDQVW